MTTPTSTPTPTPTPTASEDALPAGVVNVLFFGTDSRTKGSLTGNADALVVAQLSADRTSVTLVSIPRDSHVPYAGGGAGKINGSFPSGGTAKLRDTVSQLLGGLPIHFVVQSNFEGFIALTRWLEGFTVQNKHSTAVTVNKTGRRVVFPAGELKLESTDGLIYARERKTMPLGDLDRGQRHRAVLTGMLARLKERLAEDPAGFVLLLENLYRNVKVTGDLDPEALSGLIPALEAVAADRVTSLQVPISRFGTIKGASVCIVDQGRTGELAAALNAGDVSGYVAKYGEGYDLTRG